MTSLARPDQPTLSPAPQRPPILPYAVCGLLATATGAAMGHLVAAFTNPTASPVLAVGGQVIDATPTPVKDWAVSVFGTADKLVLILSIAVVTLALAGALGAVARAHRTFALVGLALLVALAGAAALANPSAGIADLLPAGVTGAVGVGLAAYLWGLCDQQVTADPNDVGMPPADQAGPARRSLLLAGGASAAVAVLAAAAGQALAAPRKVVAKLTLPQNATRLPVLPAGVEATVPGVSPLVTSVTEFYRIDTALSVPRIDPAEWTLSIEGDVDKPVTLTLADLMSFPVEERDITLCCVSNEVGGDLISSARWLGVRTRDVLREVGVRPGVEQILSISKEDMSISTPIQALTDDRGALFAFGMNGVELPAEHGFPVRLVTPGLYGFVGATKWLKRLIATTYHANPAYWTVRGWAEQAPVLTQSRIDTPRDGSSVSTGTVVIGGVAWAQGRGIGRVEVRIDDGPWIEATMGPDAGIDFWRQWYTPWQATAGEHQIAVRATDLTGATQPEERTSVVPRGATGWHTISVNAG